LVAYSSAGISLDLTVGTILEINHVSIGDARTGREALQQSRQVRVLSIAVCSPQGVRVGAVDRQTIKAYAEIGIGMNGRGQERRAPPGFDTAPEPRTLQPALAARGSFLAFGIAFEGKLAVADSNLQLHVVAFDGALIVNGAKIAGD